MQTIPRKVMVNAVHLSRERWLVSAVLLRKKWTESLKPDQRRLPVKAAQSRQLTLEHVVSLGTLLLSVGQTLGHICSNILPLASTLFMSPIDSENPLLPCIQKNGGNIHPLFLGKTLPLLQSHMDSNSAANFGAQTIKFIFFYSSIKFILLHVVEYYFSNYIVKIF